MFGFPLPPWHVVLGLMLVSALLTRWLAIRRLNSYRTVATVEGVLYLEHKRRHIRRFVCSNTSVIGKTLRVNRTWLEGSAPSFSAELVEEVSWFAVRRWAFVP